MLDSRTPLHNSKRASENFVTCIRSRFFAACARSKEINVAVIAHDKTKICQCLFLWPKCSRTSKVKKYFEFLPSAGPYCQHGVLGIREEEASFTKHSRHFFKSISGHNWLQQTLFYKSVKKNIFSLAQPGDISPSLQKNLSHHPACKNF